MEGGKKKKSLKAQRYLQIFKQMRIAFKGEISTISLALMQTRVVLFVRKVWLGLTFLTKNYKFRRRKSN